MPRHNYEVTLAEQDLSLVDAVAGHHVNIAWCDPPKGWGLTAAKNLQKGLVVVKYRGQIIDEAEGDRLTEIRRRGKEIVEKTIHFEHGRPESVWSRRFGAPATFQVGFK